MNYSLKNVEMGLNILLIVVAYFFGSIASAVWISKRYYGIDIRKYGSKNAGATNMLRVLGRRAALPVFAIDFLKGFAAVSLSHLSIYDAGSDAIFNLKIALVVAVVLGHIFPIFVGFKGGKGVATLAGSVLAVYPSGVLLCLLTFGIILLVTKYVSLSSVVSGVLFPVYVRVVFHEQSDTLFIFSIVVGVVLIITHRKNFRRLINGTESKIYLIKRRNK